MIRGSEHLDSTVGWGTGLVPRNWMLTSSRDFESPLLHSSKEGK